MSSSNQVSPYLKRPLRSLEEALRQRRLRLQARRPPEAAAPPAVAGARPPAKSA